MSWSQLCESLEALVSTDEPLVTALSNAAALLYTGLDDINWAGFYLKHSDNLILGPFGGNPACTVLPMGKGVCGTAAERRETLRVANVDDFPGHIACDAASRSEIVVPLIGSDGILIGVIDIDAPILDRFSEADQGGLEAFAQVLIVKIEEILAKSRSQTLFV